MEDACVPGQAHRLDLRLVPTAHALSSVTCDLTIGGTSNVYQVQADALSPAHRVIRPDFAGAGRSRC